MTRLDRFTAKIAVPDAGGCMRWLGSKKKAGYGRFADGNGGNLPAHRQAWIFANGPIPKGMEVCHSCDIRDCVNPAHLFLGTHDDNMRDMARKGRYGVRRGLDNHKAKLTPEIVREIRKSEETHSALARRYGVTYVAIRQARLGRTWRHLDEQEVQRMAECFTREAA